VSDAAVERPDRQIHLENLSASYEGFNALIPTQKENDEDDLNLNLEIGAGAPPT
jgi:hypothetical protein